jgi:D-3-phosphoglycerate dehydrogenase
MLAYSPTLTQEKAPGYVKVCTLEEVIRESDYLGLYVVINKETYNIINKKTLEMMKPTAYLINIARGEAVNEEDLYEALKNGVIAGAALDTYHLEPLPQDSKLRELKNVILTPHIAASTIEQYEGAVRNAVENITNVLEGKLPKYCKNPEIANQWYRKVEKRI